MQTPKQIANRKCVGDASSVSPIAITADYQKPVTFVITRAGIAAGVSTAFSHVCLFVRALTGKPLELSTPNLIHGYSVAVNRHTLTQRSKGQNSRSHGYETRHYRMVGSDHVLPYSAYPYAAMLPAAVTGTGLNVDTTAYVF